MIVVSVVNKLDRRRVLLTTRSTCRGEIFSSKVCDKGQGEVPLFLDLPEYPRNTVGWVEGSSRAKLDSSSRFDAMSDACDEQTDGHIPTAYTALV